MEETGEDALIVYELGRVFGIFTEHDVLQKVLARGLDPRTTTLRSVIEDVPATAPDSIPIEDAIDSLKEEKRGHLVLVDNREKVVGLISIRELLEMEVQKLHLRNKDLTCYLMSDGYGG